MKDRQGLVARFFVRLGLALLPALLLGGYSWFPALAFLPYLALVPWVVLYADDRHPRVSSGYYVFAAWVAWMACHPYFYRYGWFAAPLMGLVFFVLWIPFAPVLRRIHHRLRLPRTLTVPLVWVSIEWLRATFTLAHFDLYQLGYSQARLPALIQVADLTGGYGVSFLVAAVNGLVADAFFAVRDSAGKPWRGLRGRRLVRSAAAVAAAFLLVMAYGAVRIARAHHEDGPRLAVVQPNVRHTVRNLLGVHLTQVLMTDEKVPKGSADLIVWPENAIFDNIRREGVYLDDLAWLAGEKGSRFLVGAYGNPTDRPGKSTNGAYLVGTKGEILGEYDKQVLYPWSEFVPFDDFLGRVWPGLQRLHRSLNRKAWGYLPTGLPGDRMVLFHLPWNGGDLPFASLICIENTYPAVPAEAGRLGARFFVNITSEGEVAGIVQEQLLRICMMRAVENRIAYVRVGNTGISCFVDPEGRLQSILRGERGGTVSVAGLLIDRVPLSSGGATPYARSHDTFAVLCVLTTLVLLFQTVLPARWRPASAAVLLAMAVAGGCAHPPALGTDPTGARAALERGKNLHREQRPALAIRELPLSCADPEICRTALPYAADCFQALGQDENAVDFFTAVIRRHPQIAADAQAYRAFFLASGGRLTEALRDYRESLASEPSARVYEQQGKVQGRTYDFRGAVESFRAALALDPGNPRLRYELARALRFQGDLEGARREAEALLAQDPENDGAWTILGRVLFSIGDRAGAERAFRTAATAPKNLEARYWLARLALQDGDRLQARRLLGEITRIEAGLGRGPREE